MSRIVVTGASRGIGLSTALILARAGHTVVGAMRRPDASPELAESAAAENLPITVESLDVDSDAGVAQCFERIYAAEWSEYLDDCHVRHLWVCEACGYHFETLVKFPNYQRPAA